MEQMSTSLLNLAKSQVAIGISGTSDLRIGHYEFSTYRTNSCHQNFALIYGLCQCRLVIHQQTNQSLHST